MFEEVNLGWFLLIIMVTGIGWWLISRGSRYPYQLKKLRWQTQKLCQNNQNLLKNCNYCQQASLSKNNQNLKLLIK